MMGLFGTSGLEWPVNLVKVYPRYCLYNNPSFTSLHGSNTPVGLVTLV